MADDIMTGDSELSALIPEMWSADFYPTLLANLPFIESVDMSYSGEIASLGDTVNISQFPEFGEASELPEDGAQDAAAITVANIQLVANKQIVQDFIVTRKATLQSLPHIQELNRLAMFSVMKKIQQIIIDDTTPNAATPDHSIPYDSGTTLALADILEAKELLDEQDVGEGNRISVLGSAQENDLFNISGFTSRDFIPAGSPLTEGAIKTPVLGFEIRPTTIVSNTAHFFHPSYYTVAIQETPAVEVFNLGSQGKRQTRVNLTAIGGFKQLDGLRVVTLT